MPLKNPYEAFKWPSKSFEKGLLEVFKKSFRGLLKAFERPISGLSKAFPKGFTQQVQSLAEAPGL